MSIGSKKNNEIFSWNDSKLQVDKIEYAVYIPNYLDKIE